LLKEAALRAISERFYLQATGLYSKGGSITDVCNRRKKQTTHIMGVKKISDVPIDWEKALAKIPIRYF